MKQLIIAPFVLALTVFACSSRDDGVRTDTDRTDPDTECTARCSKAREECAKACTDEGDCLVACTDEARDCEIDCD